MCKYENITNKTQNMDTFAECGIGAGARMENLHKFAVSRSASTSIILQYDIFTVKPRRGGHRPPTEITIIMVANQNADKSSSRTYNGPLL